MFEGIWFFGVMFAACVLLWTLRARDIKSGMPADAVKRNMQKRLPIAIGAMVAALTPTLFN